MSENEIPVAEYTGKVTIGGNEIPVAVLYPDSENPIRVFWQREIVGLLTGNKKGGFERYLQPRNLQPFLPDKFKEKSLSETVMPMKIKGRSGTAQAFEATDLIDICQMYMRASKAGVLSVAQEKIAEKADIIVFAFAKLGIVAVIDEATDFQYVRARFALNKLLDRYLDDEAKKWAKKFPDEFYKQIFRLNNWEFNPTGFHKRPSVVGRWTKELIYARFPKPVLIKLEDLNPLTAGGYRKWRYHQFLTEDIGNAELQEYISNCIFLMKASANWKKFRNTFARAMGQQYQADLFE